MKQRTCMELGLCQHRSPPCEDCEYTLAPGVIDGPFRRPRASRGRAVRNLLALALVLVALGCVAVVFGFAAGYLSQLLERMS